MRTFAVILFVCSGLLWGRVDFRDNQIHVVDYEINDFVRLDYNSPETLTQLDIVEGGNIVDGLSGCNNSIINLYAGQIGGNLDANDSTKLSVYGGIVKGVIEGRDNSYTIIEDVLLEHQLRSYENGRITVRGGTFEKEIFAGYSFGEHSSLIEFVGYDFKINGTPVEYGDFASNYSLPGIDNHGIVYLAGTLTGTLVNGDSLNNHFFLYDNADITFIPEPCSLALFALAGVAMRKRS